MDYNNKRKHSIKKVTIIFDDKLSKAKTETIEGTVEDVTCYKPESGFTVFGIDYNGEYITVAGAIGMVEPGEQVKLTGYFKVHPVYGNQFKADLCERNLPSSVNAIKKYLAGGSFKGIGSSLAKKITDKFGEYTLEVIEEDPLELTKIKGISEKMAVSISKSFKETFGARKVMSEIQHLGIDGSWAVKAWKKWGGEASNIINENPYALCDEDIGLPFEEADNIFKKSHSLLDPKRIYAGIKHILIHNADNGHTCLPYDALILATKNLLCEKDEDENTGIISTISETLDTMIERGSLYQYERKEKAYIYLPDFFIAETTAATRLKLMLGEISSVNSAVLKNEISILEEEEQISYDSLQIEAIEKAVTSHAFILTGGPGTGKTTTLNAIISILERAGEKVFLTAPTGRAAKRLSEVTKRSAKTIHRLLEVDFSNETMRPLFHKNEKSPLKCDTIVIDEMSMVDSLLFDSLLRALPMRCRLIMVGDADQLPSVGAGNVLHDLIASDILPSVTLDTIFRQAAKSMIVTNAHDIVNGEYPYLESTDSDFFFLPRNSEEKVVATVTELVTKRLPSAYGYDPSFNIQVLCPSKKGDCGTWNLNLLLRDGINPSESGKKEANISGTLYRVGDKIMQTKNNYELTWRRDDGELGKGIYNGDMGIIEDIDTLSRILMIRFDDKIAAIPFENAFELDHAYAITVHKSQGSEFEAVIIPLFKANSLLSFRNLLYTAVTRAKDLLIIVGDARAIMAMVDNNRKNVRFTNLKYMLLE